MHKTYRYVPAPTLGSARTQQQPRTLDIDVPCPRSRGHTVGLDVVEAMQHIHLLRKHNHTKTNHTINVRYRVVRYGAVRYGTVRYGAMCHAWSFSNVFLGMCLFTYARQSTALQAFIQAANAKRTSAFFPT